MSKTKAQLIEENNQNILAMEAMQAKLDEFNNFKREQESLRRQLEKKAQALAFAEAQLAKSKSGGKRGRKKSPKTVEREFKVLQYCAHFVKMHGTIPPFACMAKAAECKQSQARASFLSLIDQGFAKDVNPLESKSAAYALENVSILFAPNAETMLTMVTKLKGHELRVAVLLYCAAQHHRGINYDAEQDVIDFGEPCTLSVLFGEGDLEAPEGTEPNPDLITFINGEGDTITDMEEVDRLLRV